MLRQGRAGEGLGQQIERARQNLERRRQKLLGDQTRCRQAPPETEKAEQAGGAEQKNLGRRRAPGKGCASCHRSHARTVNQGIARASMAASTRVVAHPKAPTAAMPTITMDG